MYDLFLNKKALVVDDFAEFRISLRTMLEAFGCNQIDMAKSGEEAVASYVQHQHDIVLCDYNLGPNQNGQQVLEEISLLGILRGDGAFVLVTAETTLNMVMGALEFRPDDYLTKPINKASLKTRLSKILLLKSELTDVYQSLNNRDHTEVIRCCKIHIANNSRHKSHLYRTLAETLLRQEKPKEAIHIYQQFVEKRPAQWNLLGLAQGYYMAQQYDLCIGIAKQAIDENPHCVEAFDLLANCYQQQGENQLALDFILQALAVSPLSIKRQRQTAYLAAYCNDHETELKALKKVNTLGENSIQADPDDLTRYVDKLLVEVRKESGVTRRRMLTEAQQQFGKLLKEPKQDERVELRNMMIQAHLSVILGDKTKAEAYIHRANAHAHEFLDNQDQLMLTLLEHGLQACGQDEKLNELNEQICQAKKDKQLQEHKAAQSEANKYGIKAYEHSEFDKAIGYFREALLAAPGSTAILLNLAQALMKQPFSPKKRLAIRDECLQLLGQQRLLNDDPRYARYQSLLTKAKLL